MDVEWMPIASLPEGELAVRLWCDDGRERTGWRIGQDLFEIAGSPFLVYDGSTYPNDGIAVRATHWAPRSIDAALTPEA